MSALRVTATMALAILAYLATFAAYHAYVGALYGGVGWALFVGTLILMLGLKP